MSPSRSLVVLGASLALLGVAVAAGAHGGAHQRPHARSRIDPAERYQFLMISGAGGHFHNLVLSRDLEVLFAGTHLGLFRSEDRGITWRLVDARFSLEDIHAVVLVPGRPLIYVATHSQGIVRSTDGGLRWDQHNHGLPGKDIHALALDSQHPSRLYVWAVGHGLFRSDEALSEVESLVVHPRDPERLYAGTGRGVWVSEDGGRHWRFPDGGLPHRTAGVSVPSWAPDRVFAATVGGAFVGSTDGSPWEPLPQPPDWWGPITGFAFTDERPDLVFAVSHEGVVAASPVNDRDWTPLAEFSEHPHSRANFTEPPPPLRR